MGSINKISANDYKDIANLHAACFSKSWNIQDIKNTIESSGTSGLWISSEDKNIRIASFVIFRFVMDEAEIISIGTLPQYRGKQLARKLIKRTEEILKEHSVKHLHIEVERFNNPAQKMYLSLGFLEIGVRKNYYNIGGRKIDALLMKKELA